jgi:DNA mismatch repair protein MutH
MTLELTIEAICKRLEGICGQTYTCVLTRNKGKVGYFLEDLLGIPHTSNTLDCSDGEVKCFPLKKNGDHYKPKETIAVTMLNRSDLKNKEFEESACYAKLKRTLYVPYFRTEDTICFSSPTLIDLSEHSELFEQFKSDYDEIRAGFLADETLSSSNGAYLQNRTKGPGHGSTSRAFYLRTQFITEYVAF